MTEEADVITEQTHRQYETGSGRPHPLGATPDDGGVNFALFSQHATSVELLLFDEADDLQPAQAIQLDPAVNKTFHFWHVYVRGLRPGAFYGYRVDGPRDLSQGHRFDPGKVLIDPYSRGVTRARWDRGAACVPGDNLATSMRGAIIDLKDYDWEGDRPLNRPMQDLIIYEMHVGGFTRSSTSGVKEPGTFAAVIEKIPYLTDLGVTAVELLPVMEFDSSEMRQVGGLQADQLLGLQHDELLLARTVRTACAQRTRPTSPSSATWSRLSTRPASKSSWTWSSTTPTRETTRGRPFPSGLDNTTYYYLNTQDKQYYYDYTGCGNTFNCNHPIGQKLIVDSLKFWTREMHVNGFRFDEASVLTRGLDGAPLKFPPVIWQIELDDDLADTKVVGRGMGRRRAVPDRALPRQALVRVEREVP